MDVVFREESCWNSFIFFFPRFFLEVSEIMSNFAAKEL